MTRPPPHPRFAAAVARFEAAHAEDPRRDPDGTRRAVRYHRHLAGWVERLDEDASEPLLLAAHCQHIRRWALPRNEFPRGRSGYKRWRSTLARMHADQAEEVLREVGYGDASVARVRDLLLKRGLKTDPEVQLFEDAICLVFLEDELEAFAAKHDDEKLVAILQKTWKKMSSKGHEAALKLAAELPPRLKTLLERAVP